jgi:hypothetical protein
MPAGSPPMIRRLPIFVGHFYPTPVESEVSRLRLRRNLELLSFGFGHSNRLFDHLPARRQASRRQLRRANADLMQGRGE